MIRPKSTLSVCLLATGVGLSFLLCSSGMSEEPAKAQPTVKELQMKRLAVLEQVCDVAKKLYQNARIEYTDVLSAERELFAARLAYAETREDRLKACDEAIGNARQSKELAKAHQQGARGTPVSVLKAEAFELQAQIERANIEAEK